MKLKKKWTWSLKFNSLCLWRDDYSLYANIAIDSQRHSAVQYSSIVHQCFSFDSSLAVNSTGRRQHGSRFHTVRKTDDLHEMVTSSNEMRFITPPSSARTNGTPVARRMFTKVEIVGSCVAWLPWRRQLRWHRPFVTAANVHQDGEAFFLGKDTGHGWWISKVLVGHRQKSNMAYDVDQYLSRTFWIKDISIQCLFQRHYQSQIWAADVYFSSWTFFSAPAFDGFK